MQCITRGDPFHSDSHMLTLLGFANETNYQYEDSSNRPRISRLQPSRHSALLYADVVRAFSFHVPSEGVASYDCGSSPTTH